MRNIVWYSDGAASAVAAKLAVDKYGDACDVVKCDTTNDEHPDNIRFRADVERWIGRSITLIRSDKYTGIDDVFESTGWMAGLHGARCTTELKKLVRREYEKPGDIHIFGYTLDEMKRIERFEIVNPEIKCEWILRDQMITKARCYEMIAGAGVKLPAMYSLGFDHNNCIGCVKASAPSYWARIRENFPDVFKRRAEQCRALGVRLTRDENGDRIFIDEIPVDQSPLGPDGDIECGPFCQTELSL